MSRRAGLIYLQIQNNATDFPGSRKRVHSMGQADLVARSESVAQGQPPSLGVGDFNKRSSRMAFHLLEAN